MHINATKDIIGTELNSKILFAVKSIITSHSFNLNRNHCDTLSQPQLNDLNVRSNSFVTQ